MYTASTKLHILIKELKVNSSSNGSDKTVAEFWSNNTSEEYFGITYWLANPLINQHFNFRLVGERDFKSWVKFTFDYHLGGELKDSVLSVGCGSGELERGLAQLGVARNIIGIDLSPKRIAIAREKALELNLQDTVTYIEANAENMELGSATYDAIYFNSSLHHMSDLDEILSNCSKALRPGGRLFVNEYIGPNRFAFNERERQLMSNVFQLIPERYRVSHAKADLGQVRTEVGIPDPLEVARVDPSEAIHSEEISDAVARHFDIVEQNNTIGSLMQFMLDGIAGNFKESDPQSISILNMIFEIERSLVDSGELRPHFALIVGAKPA